MVIFSEKVAYTIKYDQCKYNNEQQMVPTFCMYVCMDDDDDDDVSTTKHDVRHRVIKWLRLRHDMEREVDTETNKS